MTGAVIMQISTFGIVWSRNTRVQFFARPHRIVHETPIDHLPPPGPGQVRTLRVVRGGRALGRSA